MARNRSNNHWLYSKPSTKLGAADARRLDHTRIRNGFENTSLKAFYDAAKSPFFGPLEDPQGFAKPYHEKLTLTLTPQGELIEFVCADNTHEHPVANPATVMERTT